MNARQAELIIADVPLLTAILAGAISFLSPCVLPLVPPYLCYMAGVSVEDFRSQDVSAEKSVQRQVLKAAFVFTLGFATVFVALGAGASSIGVLLRQNLDILAKLGGLVIIVMGLHFLGVFRIAFLDRQLRHSGPGVASGPLGGFLLGLAFAVGWTPCIGPILAAILSVAAVQETAWTGAALLGVYSLGLGVPFLLAGIAIGPFLTFFSGFRRHMGTVEKIVGVLLILTGLLFITGQFTRIAYWFLETFPILGTIG